MADTVVDGLLIETTFDSAGLDQSIQAQLAGVRRLATGIDSLSRVATDGGDALGRFVREAGDVTQLNNFTTDRSVQELQELADAFPALEDAITKHDPSGVLRAIAANQRAAVDQILQNVERARAATAAVAVAPTAAPAVPTVDEAGIARVVAQAQRLAATFAEVQQALPSLSLDPAALQPAIDALTRVRTLIAGLPALPNLGAERQAAELRDLDAALQTAGQAIQGIDPSGALQVATAGVRRSVTQILGVLTEGFAQGGQAAGTEYVVGLQGQLDRANLRPPAVPPLPPTSVDVGTGFSEASAQAQRLAEAQAQVAAEAARSTNAAENLTAAELQQAIASNRASSAAVRAAAAYRQQAEETLRAGQAAAQAQRLLTASATGGEVGGQFRTLASGLQGFRTAAADAQRAAEALKATMLQTGQAGRAAGSGTAAWTRGLENLTGASNAATQATRGHGLASLQTAQHFATMTAATLGVDGAISRMVTTLGFMNLGGPLVTGVIAAAGLIALAYDALTHKTREARKALEEFVEAQNRAAQGRDPRNAIRDQFEGVPGKVEGITAAMADLNEQLAKARTAFAGTATPLGADVAKAQAEAAVAAIQAKIDALSTAAAETGRSFRDAEIARADAITRARLNAERQSAEDVLAVQQQGFSAQEAALRTALAAEEITREQFADQRVALARQAGAAEIAALRAQAEIAARDPARNEQEQAERDARIRHLEALITLRQRAIGIQVTEIRNEERLAQLAEVREISARAAQTLRDTPRVEVGVALKPELDTEELQAAVQRVVDTAKQARLDDALQAELERAAQAARDLFIPLRQIDLKLEDIGNANITGPEAGLEQLLGTLQDVGSGVSRIAQSFDFAGRQLGLFGEEGSRVLQGISDLAQDVTGAIAGIASGNPFAAVAGVVSAIGDIAGIFGGESEHDRILRENTEAIRQNTADRSEQFAGLGGQAEVQRLVLQGLAENRAALAARNAEIEQLVKQGTGREVAALQVPGVAPLEDTLRDLGVTAEELQRIAEMHGLDVLDDKGRIVADALSQLTTEIEADIQAQIRFRNTLDEQVHLASLQAAFGGGTEQPTQLELDLTALKALNTGIDERFQGVDLQNQEQVRAVFQQLLEDFRSGTLTAQELGDLTREDFLRFLDDGAAGLEALAKGTGDALDQIANVPSGFRQAAAAFNATVVGLTAQGPVQPVNPFLPGGPGDGAALNLSLADDLQPLVDGIKRAQEAQSQKIADAIRRIQPSENHVTVEGANVDIDDLVDRVLAAMDRQQASRRGNTTPGLQGGF